MASNDRFTRDELWGPANNLATNSWQNTNGPKGDEEYDWSVAWKFNNGDLAAGEDVCTIVLWQVGRTPRKVPEIVSVETTDGPKGASRVFGRITLPNESIDEKYDGGYKFRGTAIGVFQVQVDRKKITGVTSSHAHVWNGSRAPTRNQIYILSGALGVTGFIHPLLPGVQHQVDQGGVIIGGGARYLDRQSNVSWNTGDSFAVGAHWYGQSWAGAAFGGSGRGWSISDPNIWVNWANFIGNRSAFVNTAYKLSRGGGSISENSPFIDGWFTKSVPNQTNPSWSDMMVTPMSRNGTPTISVTRADQGRNPPAWRLEGGGVRFYPSDTASPGLAQTGDFNITANFGGTSFTGLVNATVYPYDINNNGGGA